MKLITKAVLKSLPSINHVINQPAEERVIIAHLYNPIGVGDWFVMAADPMGADYRLFGLVLLEAPVFETFSLSELEKLRLPFGERIRMDKTFKPMNLNELRNNIHILI